MTATPALDVKLVVNTGSFSPMWIFALSRLRTRMRGFDSRLLAPSVPRSVAISDGLAVWATCCAQVSRVTTVPVDGGRP